MHGLSSSALTVWCWSPNTGSGKKIQQSPSISWLKIYNARSSSTKWWRSPKTRSKISQLSKSRGLRRIPDIDQMQRFDSKDLKKQAVEQINWICWIWRTWSGSPGTGDLRSKHKCLIRENKWCLKTSITSCLCYLRPRKLSLVLSMLRSTNTQY